MVSCKAWNTVGVLTERHYRNQKQVLLEKPRQLTWGFCQCWVREMGTDPISRELRCLGQVNLDVEIQPETGTHVGRVGSLGKAGLRNKTIIDIWGSSSENVVTYAVTP